MVGWISDKKYWQPALDHDSRERTDAWIISTTAATPLSFYPQATPGELSIVGTTSALSRRHLVRQIVPPPSALPARQAGTGPRRRDGPSPPRPRVAEPPLPHTWVP